MKRKGWERDKHTERERERGRERDRDRGRETRGPGSSKAGRHFNGVRFCLSLVIFPFVGCRFGAYDLVDRGLLDPWIVDSWIRVPSLSVLFSDSDSVDRGPMDLCMPLCR